jgi:hypothetical protein
MLKELIRTRVVPLFSFESHESLFDLFLFYYIVVKKQWVTIFLPVVPPTQIYTYAWGQNLIWRVEWDDLVKKKCDKAFWMILFVENLKNVILNWN